MTGEERMTQAYRNVFVLGQDGKIVLADLLASLGFFNQDISDVRGMERRNVAQEILNKLGCFNAGAERSGEVASALVKGLCEVPVTRKEKEDSNDR